jgi:hypothetical protein
MPKAKVGLYVGVDSLGGVVLQNGKIVSSVRYDLASLEEESHVENLSDDVKWEALINKAIRDMNVDTKDVSLSLADRDFIFRFFDMPLMKKADVQSSLTYEIEKYIPFKLEELRWDYGYVPFPKEKKIDVSFIGVKEDIFQNIQGLFTRLGFNPILFEPSAVSLARAIKTVKKFSKVKSFALLDLTGGEGYLTFFHYDLPVFNRYFPLVRKNGALKPEEVVNPVRLSFQYFEREFNFYKLENLIVMSPEPDDALLNMLKEDLQVSVSICCPEDIAPRGGSLEVVKALGAMNFAPSSYKFKPILRPTFEQLARAKREAPLNRTMILSSVGICLAAYASVFMFTENKLSIEQNSLSLIQGEVKLPEAISSVGWAGAQNFINSKKSEAKEIEALKTEYTTIASFLEKMVRSKQDSFVPEGIWLNSIALTRGGNKWAGSLSGYAFYADERREREAVDAFVYKFKKDPTIRSYFSDTQLTNSVRAKEGDFSVMNFSVVLQ